MRILVVSPIASHPQNQGNSARIFAVCRQLQTLGHTVHFLYYPLEGLTAEQQESMSSCWDQFHSLPCDLPNTGKTLGDFYGVDDWYDPRLGEYAAQLHARWNFDAALVNYVWFSAVLDSLPDDVCKVIDTHDVFGDRHLRFKEIGLEPEWFYTTVPQERLGLTRANVVIAIQSEEASYFMGVLDGSDTKVLTIGHAIPPRFSESRRAGEVPVVGYLGSGNPFNVSSLKSFAKTLQACPELLSKYRFVLAGSICDRIGNLPPFEISGRVDDLDDFYRKVDIVINPMNGGTGLKIKTLEALSFGCQTVGTSSSFAGIPIVRSPGSSNSQFSDPLGRFFSSTLYHLSEKDAEATALAYNRQCAFAVKKLSETMISFGQS